MENRIGHLKVEIFKIQNRAGFAAVCSDCLTEGKSKEEAFERMVKAVRRISKNNK